MQSHNNKAIIAAAGSRKTQHIIDQVLGDSTKRVLVTTYTNENLNQIVNRLSAGTGVLPSHVTVMGWFTFLMNQCARPYQSFVLGETGVMGGLNFLGQRSRFARKDNPKRYYLDPASAVYRNEVAALACEANQRSGGKVIDRLAGMYDHIYVDEIQDMAGYDLDLLNALMKSPLALTMVGDPRQATFSTNTAAKNRQYKGSRIVDWFSERTDLCAIDNRVESFRCNQAICDFADDLYPELPRTISKNAEVTGHDGVSDIKMSDVDEYMQKYSPIVLRWNRQTPTGDLDAMNMGASKGSTYDRVLIFPTKPMIAYYHTRDFNQLKERAKFYVAVTRAKYSVTFALP
ncbi:UvrD-helicase domain-containing protein [Streptomyces hirsutus]|uniref:UvrD-helicase domain-containing protein n=1 Tax=Streptomyces hirsutus TaxID=35620 RepID=A0ABZ1GLN5_9ACTN|nr:UvrD-helicase domain-containing protein [Streptomyces hirsutus]WSD06145.1 UvrD-helicase domain-containing protein [Streptomyces hirsutus]